MEVDTAALREADKYVDFPYRGALLSMVDEVQASLEGKLSRFHEMPYTLSLSVPYGEGKMQVNLVSRGQENRSPASSTVSTFSSLLFPSLLMR